METNTKTLHCKGTGTFSPHAVFWHTNNRCQIKYKYLHAYKWREIKSSNFYKQFEVIYHVN